VGPNLGLVSICLPFAVPPPVTPLRVTSELLRLPGRICPRTRDPTVPQSFESLWFWWVGRLMFESSISLLLSLESSAYAPDRSRGRHDE